MSKITIYGFPPSTYTQTALAVAKHVGAEVELVGLEFKKPSHFERHPYGRMPAMKHGEVDLYETAAIVSYLDRAHGKAKLVPADALGFARMQQWISVAIDYAYPALVGEMHDEDPNEEAVSAAGAQLKLIDVGLGDAPFLAGTHMSLADFMLYPMVRFCLDKLGRPALDGLPALARWYATMSERVDINGRGGR